MDEPPKDESTPILPYATPRPANDPQRLAFGNVWGNLAVGMFALIGSCIVGPWLAMKAQANSLLLYLLLPMVTFLIGNLSALKPRYRGVLLGMMAVAIGVPLLIAGLCILR